MKSINAIQAREFVNKWQLREGSKEEKRKILFEKQTRKETSRLLSLAFDAIYNAAKKGQTCTQIHAGYMNGVGEEEEVKRAARETAMLILKEKYKFKVNFSACVWDEKKRRTMHFYSNLSSLCYGDWYIIFEW